MIKDRLLLYYKCLVTLLRSEIGRYLGLLFIPVILLLAFIAGGVYEAKYKLETGEYYIANIFLEERIKQTESIRMFKERADRILSQWDASLSRWEERNSGVEIEGSKEIYNYLFEGIRFQLEDIYYLYDDMRTDELNLKDRYRYHYYIVNIAIAWFYLDRDMEHEAEGQLTKLFDFFNEYAEELGDWEQDNQIESRNKHMEATVLCLKAREVSSETEVLKSEVTDIVSNIPEHYRKTRGIGKNHPILGNCL